MNWIKSITVEEWNQILKIKKANSENGKSRIATGDKICFYVIGTSSIKCIADVTGNGFLQLVKVGDLNYFGIANSLSFVKDHENVTKYLRNFNGIANLGKPIPATDMEMIYSQMTSQEIPQAVVETPTTIESSEIKPGSPHETMYLLENSLRAFISNELQKISKNWVKERIPDPKILQEWERRREQDKKQRKWFESKEIDIINYSDLYDLVTLIVNRGNWTKCFEKIFGKQSIIESKIYELIPIRNNLAHNRPLTDEEQMILNLYSKQILRLIGNQGS